MESEAQKSFVVKLLKPQAVWRNVFYITPTTHAHKRLLFKKDHSRVYVCKHLELELQALWASFSRALLALKH